MTVWLILQFWEDCCLVCPLLWAFQDFRFSLIISWLFRGQGRTYLATSSCFCWLKKTKYQKRNFAFALNLKDIPYNGYSRETGLDRVLAEYVLPKGAFMSRTVATFVQKVGLIWLKRSFLLQLFRTQM